MMIMVDERVLNEDMLAERRRLWVASTRRALVEHVATCVQCRQENNEAGIAGPIPACMVGWQLLHRHDRAKVRAANMGLATA